MCQPASALPGNTSQSSAAVQQLPFIQASLSSGHSPSSGHSLSSGRSLSLGHSLCLGCSLSLGHSLSSGNSQSSDQVFRQSLHFVSQFKFVERLH